MANRVSSVSRVFTRVKRQLSLVQENIRLSHPLDQKDHIEFDKILYHFAMTTDRMQNLKIFTGKENKLNWKKKFHNFIVWFILFTYWTRSLACFMTNNKAVLMYLGDISPYLGGNRLMFLLPVAIWAFYALSLNSLFTFDKKVIDNL